MATDSHDLTIEAGVEPEGIDASALIKATVVLVAFVVVAVITVFEWQSLEVQVAQVAATQESGYPALREYRAEVAGKLGRYAVLDAEKGSYQIPIDRAIDLVVRERSADTALSTELRLSP